MLNKLLASATARPELLILTLMILIIAMLIIPLPTPLVDFLIGLNIVISILVFMGSFYITRVLDFSSFPALLLITTLFRLALSISTSRLILRRAAAPGSAWRRRKPRLSSCAMPRTVRATWQAYCALAISWRRRCCSSRAWSRACAAMPSSIWPRCSTN